jgi:hypothetical protein
LTLYWVFMVFQGRFNICMHSLFLLRYILVYFQTLNDGDMALMDMGAEYSFYGSDITCSYPVSSSTYSYIYFILFFNIYNRCTVFVISVRIAIGQGYAYCVQWTVLHASFLPAVIVFFCLCYNRTPYEITVIREAW